VSRVSMDFLVIQPAATSMERCGSGHSREVSTHAQPTHIAVNSGAISSSDVNPFLLGRRNNSPLMVERRLRNCPVYVDHLVTQLMPCCQHIYHDLRDCRSTNKNRRQWGVVDLSRATQPRNCELFSLAIPGNKRISRLIVTQV